MNHHVIAVILRRDYTTPAGIFHRAGEILTVSPERADELEAAGIARRRRSMVPPETKHPAVLANADPPGDEEDDEDEDDEKTVLKLQEI